MAIDSRFEYHDDDYHTHPLLVRDLHWYNDYHRVCVDALHRRRREHVHGDRRDENPAAGPGGTGSDECPLVVRRQHPRSRYGYCNRVTGLGGVSDAMTRLAS